ncbi:hypothetical protein [Vibrio neonatus]
MSRPTFIKLLELSNIPLSRTGNRRKEAFADLAELSALCQETGMGY